MDKGVYILNEKAESAPPFGLPNRNTRRAKKLFILIAIITIPVALYLSGVIFKIIFEADYSKNLQVIDSEHAPGIIANNNICFEGVLEPEMELYEKPTGDFIPNFYAGIPDKFRPAIWGKHFLEFHRNKRSYLNIGDEKKIDLTDLESRIERDITRTLTAHPKFRVKEGEPMNSIQESLKQLLVAYAKSDPDVGYNQGMGVPAAFLLTYFSANDALFFFHVLMKSIGLRNLYVESDVEKQKLNDLAQDLLNERMPKLAGQINNNPVTWKFIDICISKMTKLAFVDNVNFELSARIWDLFLKFNFNYETLFPMVTVALIKVNEKALLINEDNLAVVFKDLMRSTNPEDFISAFKIIEETEKKPFFSKRSLKDFSFSKVF